MRLRRFIPPDPTAGQPVPPGFATWNKALQAAFRRGWRARLAGLAFEACPYVDRRKYDGRLTWSRAFRSAWQEGFRWAERASGPAERPELSLEPPPEPCPFCAYPLPPGVGRYGCPNCLGEGLDDRPPAGRRKVRR